MSFQSILKKQGVLSELPEIYRGKSYVIIMPIFRGLTGNSARLKWLIISDIIVFPFVIYLRFIYEYASIEVYMSL